MGYLLRHIRAACCYFRSLAAFFSERKLGLRDRHAVWVWLLSALQLLSVGQFLTRFDTNIRSRESLVGIMTRLMAEQSGVRMPNLFSKTSRPAPGLTEPSVQWVSRVFFLEVKRPGREANHSPPSSADVKNDLNCYDLHGLTFACLLVV